MTNCYSNFKSSEVLSERIGDHQALKCEIEFKVKKAPKFEKIVIRDHCNANINAYYDYMKSSDFSPLLECNDVNKGGFWIWTQGGCTNFRGGANFRHFSSPQRRAILISQNGQRGALPENFCAFMTFLQSFSLFLKVPLLNRSDIVVFYQIKPAAGEFFWKIDIQGLFLAHSRGGAGQSQGGVLDFQGGARPLQGGVAPPHPPPTKSTSEWMTDHYIVVSHPLRMNPNPTLICVHVSHRAVAAPSPFLNANLWLCFIFQFSRVPQKLIKM